MRQPWLDMQNLIGSFNGFAELQGIGYALRTLRPFNNDLAERLRVDLGDWQAPIDLVEESLALPVARTKFYRDRGLNLALTNFPAAAFLEGTAIAGLRPPAPPIADSYSREEEQTTPEDEEQGFARANAAYDRLLRVETQIRHFIDERMTAAFGPRWIKQRVPGPIRQSWEEKRQIARQAGEREWPLIAYADFTDYVQIITRRDNWEAVFAAVFERQSLVQESFQRLYTIRLATMHSRVITQDDELYLLVETMRLLKAITSC
jgi:hypothetical protein